MPDGHGDGGGDPGPLDRGVEGVEVVLGVVAQQTQAGGEPGAQCGPCEEIRSRGEILCSIYWGNVATWHVVTTESKELVSINRCPAPGPSNNVSIEPDGEIQFGLDSFDHL